MADELQGNLHNYKLQLQQVEAALTTDSDNEELKKLKLDLEEVIELTLDLIKTQIVESKGKARSTAQDEVKASKHLSSEQPVIEGLEDESHKGWKVGDRCLALQSKDGLYNEATIDDICEARDEATVSFNNDSEESEITSISLLREVKHGKADGSDGKSKKVINSKQREYQKLKKQKKLQRYKAMEEEREGEKNKWLTFSKKKKGLLKKSIFASPDSVNGRVGVGTCGTSGKPMTEYTTADKWRKGMD